MFNYFKISKFLLYLVPFTVVIVTTSTLFPFIVGKYVFFRAIVGLASVSFLLGLIFSPKAKHYFSKAKEVIKSPVVIGVVIFTIAFVLAGLFGFDPSYSFWSNFERGEGGLQIIFLLLFLILLRLLLKDKRDWRKFMWVIVVAAVLMILYGVGAGLKYIDADTQIITVGGEERVILSGTGGPLYQTFNGFIGDSFSREGYRFQGSIGNSSYVAVYLIFASFFASYLFITSNRSRELLRYVLALSIMFFIFFFFLAATRGAFVGLGLAIAAGILYLIFSNKKYRKPLLVFIIVMVLLFSVGFYFRDNPGLQKIPGSRIFDISIGTKTFQDRLIMWNIAWEGFKERPIFGWGPENYDEVFFRKYNTDYYNPGEGYGAWFDRAHNLFFDYLVETGIVGAVAYTAIFVIFFWLFFKKIGRNNKKASENDNRRAAGNGQSGLLTKNRKALINAMILVVPVAYLIQGLVLFEVLVIYMQLYIFLAFFDWKINGPEYKVQN